VASAAAVAEESAPDVAQAAARSPAEAAVPRRRAPRAAPKIEIPVDPNLEQVETVAVPPPLLAEAPAAAPRKPRPRRAPARPVAADEPLEQVETRSGE
jgi:hypothetical protein